MAWGFAVLRAFKTIKVLNVSNSTKHALDLCSRFDWVASEMSLELTAVHADNPGERKVGPHGKSRHPTRSYLELLGC